MKDAVRSVLEEAGRESHMFTLDRVETSQRLREHFLLPLFVHCFAANVKLEGRAAKEDSHIRR